MRQPHVRSVPSMTCTTDRLLRAQVEPATPARTRDEARDRYRARHPTSVSLLDLFEDCDAWRHICDHLDAPRDILALHLVSADAYRAMGPALARCLMVTLQAALDAASGRSSTVRRARRATGPSSHRTGGRRVSSSCYWAQQASDRRSSGECVVLLGLARRRLRGTRSNAARFGPKVLMELRCKVLPGGVELCCAGSALPRAPLTRVRSEHPAGCVCSDGATMLS